MSKLSFLDGEPSEAEVVTADAETQPPPEQPAPPAQPAPQPAPQPEPAQQPRAADGKFAPKSPAEAAPEPVAAAPAVAAAPEPVIAPVAAQPPPEPGHVPIAAMLDEREKRQALERRVAEFEAAQAKAKAEAEANAKPPPDFTDDPEGHLAAQNQNIATQLYIMKRDLSKKFAVKEYGQATVDEALTWAAERAGKDPQFNQQAIVSDDPCEFAIAAWKRDKILTEVSVDDFDEYRAWKAAKATPAQDAPIIAAQPAPPKPTPTPPPRSLAEAPSAGGPAIVPSGNGQAYAGVFGG